MWVKNDKLFHFFKRYPGILEEICQNYSPLWYVSTYEYELFSFSERHLGKKANSLKVTLLLSLIRSLPSGFRIISTN